MAPDFVLAGTGSRSLRTADRDVQVAAMDLCMERVAQRVVEHGSRLIVMSGMAEGFDECLARAALRLRVRLWCAIPSRTYLGYYWGRKSLLERDRLAEAEEIVGQAWKVTYVAEQILNTTALTVDGLHINFHRNLFMTEQADDFVVWDPTSKGTAHCVEAIRQAGKWRDDMVLSLDAPVSQIAAF